MKLQFYDKDGARLQSDLFGEPEDAIRKLALRLKNVRFVPIFIKGTRAGARELVVTITKQLSGPKSRPLREHVNESSVRQ
jgi:hypothetical protein